MDVVARWTGQHGLALAEAMRLPREVFARQLGISPRTVADWARQPGTPLSLRTQELLDVMLERGTRQVHQRFAELLHGRYWPGLSTSARTAADDESVGKAVRFEGDAVRAVELLDGLAAADLSDQRSVREAAWVSIAGPGAITAYLFGARSSGIESVDGAYGQPAAQVRSVAHRLMDLDFQIGGGVVRKMLLVYLQSEVMPLLRSSRRGLARGEIFQAAAEVAQLLGWSAYDAGAHGAAQGYYIQGLRLAKEAGDKRLAGYLLGDLSHQANYLGKYNEALQLAHAGQAATHGAATATQATALLAMEARALASLGECQQCIQVIGRAERLFERSRPDSDPHWISYFTADELAGEMAHCFRDLGRYAEARQFAIQALAPTTPARTRVLIEMVNAQLALKSGELEEALAVAHSGLAHAGLVASARCAQYIADFRTGLRAIRANGVQVKGFLEELRQSQARDIPRI
jgi:tetratricopeptide (TPR) repeat protein